LLFIDVFDWIVFHLFGFILFGSRPYLGSKQGCHYLFI
jgi:hypothetical protein